jgi:hypothetical protein
MSRYVILVQEQTLHPCYTANDDGGNNAVHIQMGTHTFDETYYSLV